MPMDELYTSLGIPPDYGTDPFIPRYEDAEELVEAGENFVAKPQFLTPATADAWQRMRRKAGEDDIDLLIVSGFRSIDHQVELIQNKLAAGHSIMSILKVNAAPGFSQHHSGMAIDITTPGIDPLSEEFEDTGAFHWLIENAYRFGFNMPYERGNRFGFIYEPWHWSQVPLLT